MASIRSCAERNSRKVVQSGCRALLGDVLYVGGLIGHGTNALGQAVEQTCDGQLTQQTDDEHHTKNYSETQSCAFYAHFLHDRQRPRPS